MSRSSHVTNRAAGILLKLRRLVLVLGPSTTHKVVQKHPHILASSSDTLEQNFKALQVWRLHAVHLRPSSGPCAGGHPQCPGQAVLWAARGGVVGAGAHGGGVLGPCGKRSAAEGHVASVPLRGATWQAQHRGRAQEGAWGH